MKKYSGSRCMSSPVAIIYKLRQNIYSFDNCSDMSRDALVVGINKYPFLKNSLTGKCQHLNTPASDAEAIAQLLETYGNFRVRRLPASNIDGKLQVDPEKIIKAEELEKAIR